MTPLPPTSDPATPVAAPPTQPPAAVVSSTTEAPPAAPPPAAAPPAVDPLEALRADIAARRAQQSTAPPSQPQQQQYYPQPVAPPPAQPPSVDIEHLNRQFLQNPMAMLGAAAQASQQGVLNQLAPTLAANAMQQVRTESGNPALFDVLAPEIQEAMSGVDAVARTNPETWRNAFYLVRGKYHDRLSSMPRPATNAVAAGGPAPAGAPPAAAPSPARLTDEAARVAAGFGFTAEQYTEGVTDGVFIFSNTTKQR